jgi:hypothetical protein
VEQEGCVAYVSARNLDWKPSSFRKLWQIGGAEWKL